MKKKVPTLVKWAGGKKQLLLEFDKYIPENLRVYVEPFLGGGAVLFFVLKYKKPGKVFAYDINKDLINLYVQVRDNPKELISLLRKFEEDHNKSKNPKKYYYDKREEYNTPTRNKIKKAALLIYLNKTCFNGLYRVNSLGEFNVPFGHYKKAKIFEEGAIREASKLLKRARIESKDFREIKFPKKSFIYFDPPYWSEKNKGFTSYNKSDFSEKDQLSLRDTILKLKDEGHKIVLSNSDTSFIKKLYVDKALKIKPVDVRRMINCNGNARNIIKELIITNIK